MRRAAATVFLTGALVLSMGILAFAQMGMMNKPADSSQKWQKPMGMNESQMLDRMSNNQQMMYNEFDSLQTSWNKMMVMNDMSNLKDAMGNYQQAMKAMRQQMAQQGTMYKKALSNKNDRMNMNMDQKQMLQKMDGNYQIMSSRMDSLQTMTGKMMNMNNMSELKSAMKDYQHAMKNMHNQMANQGTMYKRMMAMMGNSGGRQHQMMKHDDDN